MSKNNQKIVFLALVLILNSCAKKVEVLQDLTLGKDKLKQVINGTNLTEGVTFYHVKRGSVSGNDFYTLSSGIISKNDERILVKRLDSLGISSRIEKAAENGPHGEFLGNIVRIGKYKTETEAKVKALALEERNIPMAIRYTAEDGNATSGPFEISILEVDFKVFEGKIISSLGHDKIQEKETTSAIVTSNNAIAGVNAGFFAWREKVGTIGDPAGISIIDGELVSEATNGRAALIIDNNGVNNVYVAHNVRTNISLQLQDTTIAIDGINRKPGLILNCGNGTRVPIHDFVCENPNELIVFNSFYGKQSATGTGMEFLVNEQGGIMAVHQNRGSDIPKNGIVIQATGSYVSLLNSLITKESIVKVKTEVLSDEGIIPLKKGVYAINGGPTLIEKGKLDVAARYKEGWETHFSNLNVTDEFVDKKDKASVSDSEGKDRSGFYHGWVVRRHPRTAIGITKDQKVYIAVVYGRQPKITAGASVTEMATLMKSLGAYDAFNLDGGGSTMMIVNGEKTGKSSDANGERAVGDALLIMKWVS